MVGAVKPARAAATTGRNEPARHGRAGGGAGRRVGPPSDEPGGTDPARRLAAAGDDRRQGAPAAMRPAPAFPATP
ncbi:MAG TPA: hypothetical protein VFU81_19000, partial [Thermomicrobiales bacterium]|nr:hypothetical protein [Thermomicrobiales bacterium]